MSHSFSLFSPAINLLWSKLQRFGWFGFTASGTTERLKLKPGSQTDLLTKAQLSPNMAFALPTRQREPPLTHPLCPAGRQLPHLSPQSPHSPSPSPPGQELSLALGGLGSQGGSVATVALPCVTCFPPDAWQPGPRRSGTRGRET